MAEATDGPVRVEISDGVAVITLDRPEVRNAMNRAMNQGLGDAYRRCDEDDDVRAVVLTGTPPAFSAGADLTSGGDTFGAVDASTFDASPISPRAWEVRKPVIAAVNGHAIGLGFTVAMQCDLRIVADDAKYGVVQVQRGVMGDAHSHWTVSRTAGLADAAEVLLTGRTFDGPDLVRLGLANRSLPAGEVLPAALELAAGIARDTAPLSVAFSKRLLWDSFGMSRDEVGRYETELHLHLMGSADAREGVLAFLERRAPAWSYRVARDWPGWPDE